MEEEEEEEEEEGVWMSYGVERYVGSRRWEMNISPSGRWRRDSTSLITFPELIFTVFIANIERKMGKAITVL